MSKTYEITTETVSPQPVLSMRFAVEKEQIAAKFAEVLPAVYGHAMQGAAKPAGQPFARYYGECDGKIDIEAGVPTDGPGEGTDAIKVSELPGGEVATTLHVGPYERLGEAHNALLAWAKENGRAPSGGPWEIYVSDPGAEPDPNKWETRVYLPL